MARRRLAAGWPWPGLPIDQRSSLFTVCVFSAGLREGMARLGVQLTRTEAVDQLGMWRFLGARLGVDPALMPEVRERLLGLGITPVGNTPDEFGAQWRADLAKFEAVVKAAAIKAE